MGNTPCIKAEREKIEKEEAAKKNGPIRAKRNGKTKRPKMSMPDVEDFDC